MNYITSCPKCDTHFVLSKAHIKSHRGKVQCGSCEHVFNAKNRLTEVSDDHQSKEASPTTLEDEVSIKEVIEQEKPAPEPAFLQKETIIKKSSVWLTPLIFILLVAAVLQSIYFMRVKIAAEYPQFKPMLVQACAQLNCEIDLPRNLDFITISDSDMQESNDYESVINFSSVITNNATFTQAYPIIKLTLTNADDVAMIEKLIQPKSYVKNINMVKNGFAPGKELAIKLSIQIIDTSIAGYRIELIY